MRQLPRLKDVDGEQKKLGNDSCVICHAKKRRSVLRTVNFALPSSDKCRKYKVCNECLEILGPQKALNKQQQCVAILQLVSEMSDILTVVENDGEYYVMRRRAEPGARRTTADHVKVFAHRMRYLTGETIALCKTKDNLSSPALEGMKQRGLDIPKARDTTRYKRYCLCNRLIERLCIFEHTSSGLRFVVGQDCYGSRKEEFNEMNYLWLREHECIPCNAACTGSVFIK